MKRRIDICRGCPLFRVKDYQFMQDTFRYYACEEAKDQVTFPFKLKQHYEKNEVPEGCLRLMEYIVIGQEFPSC